MDKLFNEKKWNLAKHFAGLYGLDHMSPLSVEQAEAALADPQKHVDAIVEAGMLAPSEDGSICYVVRKQHKHAWTVKLAPYQTRDGDFQSIVCKECGTPGRIVEE